MTTQLQKRSCGELSNFRQITEQGYLAITLWKTVERASANTSTNGLYAIRLSYVRESPESNCHNNTWVHFPKEKLEDKKGDTSSILPLTLFWNPRSLAFSRLTTRLARSASTFSSEPQISNERAATYLKCLEICKQPVSLVGKGLFQKITSHWTLNIGKFRDNHDVRAISKRWAREIWQEVGSQYHIKNMHHKMRSGPLAISPIFESRIGALSHYNINSWHFDYFFSKGTSEFPLYCNLRIKIGNPAYKRNDVNRLAEITKSWL